VGGVMLALTFFSLSTLETYLFLTGKLPQKLHTVLRALKLEAKSNKSDHHSNNNNNNYNNNSTKPFFDEVIRKLLKEYEKIVSATKVDNFLEHMAEVHVESTNGARVRSILTSMCIYA
jgi:hypothetical protein